MATNFIINGENKYRNNGVEECRPQSTSGQTSETTVPLSLYDDAFDVLSYEFGEVGVPCANNVQKNSTTPSVDISAEYDDIKVAGILIEKRKLQVGEKKDKKQTKPTGHKSEISLTMQRRQRGKMEQSTDEIASILKQLREYTTAHTATNSVSLMNEACMTILHKPPVFEVLRIGGEDHMPQFLSMCFVVINSVCLRTYTITTSKKNGNKQTTQIWLDYLSKGQDFKQWYQEGIFKSIPLAHSDVSRINNPYIKHLDVSRSGQEWERDLTEEGVEPNPGPGELTKQNKDWVYYPKVVNQSPAIWVDSISGQTTKSEAVTMDFPGLWVANITHNIEITVFGAVPQHALENYGSGTLTVAIEDAISKRIKLTLPLTNAFTSKLVVDIPYTPKVSKPQFVATIELGALKELTFVVNVVCGSRASIEISNQPIWITDIPSEAQVNLSQSRHKKVRSARALRPPPRPRVFVEDLTTNGDVEANPGPEVKACIICYKDVCEHTQDMINTMYQGVSFKPITAVEDYENDDGGVNPTLIEDQAQQQEQVVPEGPGEEEHLDHSHDNLMKRLEIEPKGSQPFSKEYLESHINNMTSRLNNTSIWAEHLHTFFPNIPIKTANRFQLFANDRLETDCMNDLYDETQFKIDVSKIIQTTARDRKDKVKPQLEEEDERKRKLKLKEKKQRSDIDLEAARKNQHNAIIRIADKWKNEPWLIIRAINTKVKKQFLEKIAEQVFGCNWDEKTEMDNIQFSTYCYLRGIEKRFERAKILLIDNRIKTWTYERDADWEKYYSDQFGEDWYSDVQVLAAEQTLHNKKVHAYNGNPVFSQTMDDVDKSDNWPKFYAENKGGRRMLASEIQTLFSYLPSDVSVVSTDLSKQDAITANVINGDNQTAGPCSVRFPNTSLIPRQVRQAAGNQLVVSTGRLQTHLIDICDYMAGSLRQTELGEELTNAVRNQNSSAWRKDNVTLSGFSQFDMVGLNTVPSIKGLSLEQMLAKVDLLHSVVSHNVASAWIPNSEYDAIDQLTKPTANHGVLGINDSAVFGEACGGATAVFPFTGVTGRLAFHLTLASIPEDRRPNAIFMPPAILQAFESGPEAIAMFTMMWAEWPFGLYTISKQTTDHANLNPGNQSYVANECTTKVPGYHTLDIVLPRQSSAANPTAQGQANGLTVVRPHTGGHASTVFPNPNALLNVSFVGPGGLTDYNLCEYLYTWALTFDQTTIRAMLARLNAIVNINPTLEAMHEVNLSCHSAFGVLIEQNADNTILVNHNSMSQLRVSDAFCFWKGQTATNWPAPTGIGSYDRLILRTDILSWNQVVLGLRTNDELVPDHEDLPEYIGNPRCTYWESVVSQLIATVTTVNFANVGISSLSWEQALTNTTMMSYQRLARDLYCRIGQGGQLAVGRFGNMLRYLHTNLTDYSPCVVSILGYDITLYHRILPQVHFAAPIRGDHGRMTLMPPGIMLDVQMHMFCSQVPKWVSSFPPPKGTNSTMGYSDGLYLLRTTDLLNASTFIEKDALNPALDSNEAPDIEDETLWNQRLLWWDGTPTRIICDYTGVMINAGTYPVAQMYLKQRPRTNYPGLVNPTGTLNANTILIPRANNVGLRIFVFEPINIAIHFVQAMKRVNQLNKQSWLINGITIKPSLLAISNKVDKWQSLTDKANFQQEESAHIEQEILPPEAVPNLQEQMIVNI